MSGGLPRRDLLDGSVRAGVDIEATRCGEIVSARVGEPSSCRGPSVFIRAVRGRPHGRNIGDLACVDVRDVQACPLGANRGGAIGDIGACGRQCVVFDARR